MKEARAAKVERFVEKRRSLQHFIVVPFAATREPIESLVCYLYT